jgi:Vitamin K-dependent gamma-carboxylase
MHGLLRLVFYGGLFLLALDNRLSPLRGIRYYAATDPELFRSYGLIDLLGIPYIAPEIILVIIGLTSVAWIFAAIGLWSRVSAILTAAGATFLHGMFLGSNALNHNWFLPVYGLIALCFARTNDRWSVDYYLKKWRHKGTQKPEGALADTGFARKLFLVLAVGFYFTAGLTKLADAGPGWADGHTIGYFALERGAAHPLGPLLAQNLWLCTVLAVGSLALELGAPAALFSRRARYALVGGWALMHLGIRWSIGPNYYENMLCFPLLIDWRGARAVVPRQAGRGTLTAVATASLLFPLILAVPLLKLFWWPVTNVYMYASYFSHSKDIRANYPRTDYHDAAAAQRIARSYLEARPSIEATEHFAFLATLRLAGGNAEPFYFENVPGIATYKQWILTVVRPVLIEDIAAKPPGRIDYDPARSQSPAQRLLLDYLPLLRKHADPWRLKGYQRLELTYPLREGPVVVASVRLSRE